MGWASRANPRRERILQDSRDIRHFLKVRPDLFNELLQKTSGGEEAQPWHAVKLWMQQAVAQAIPPPGDEA